MLKQRSVKFVRTAVTARNCKLPKLSDIFMSVQQKCCCCYGKISDQFGAVYSNELSYAAKGGYTLVTLPRIVTP